MNHLKTYEEVRWYFRGKLGPEDFKVIPSEKTPEFVEITPDNIEVGLDLWIGNNIWGTIVSLDDNLVKIDTLKGSNFICPTYKFYDFNFKKKI